MACGCSARSEDRYLWVPEGESSESPNTVMYDSRIQVKAKIMRQGGTFIPMTRLPDGRYVAKVNS